jgi:hypothetical protein
LKGSRKGRFICNLTGIIMGNSALWSVDVMQQLVPNI